MRFPEQTFLIWASRESAANTGGRQFRVFGLADPGRMLCLLVRLQELFAGDV